MGLLGRVALLCLLLAALGPSRARADERPGDQPVLDTEVGRTVYRELREAYAARSHPDFARAVTALSSTQAEQRRFGGEYLLALFRQTAWDEKHGLTPPFQGWKIGGGGPQDDGAEIRWRAADAFMRSPPPKDAVEALPAALWLYENDPIPADRLAGMRVLALVRSAESDAAVAAALARPDDNADVLVLALWAAHVRRMGTSGEAIRALCGDHRAEVREAALKAARALGLGELPTYDPAVRLSSVLERRLRALLACVEPAAPPEARWAWVEPLPAEGAGEDGRRPAAFGAWLLQESEASLGILDWHGRARTLEATRWRALPETLATTARRLAEVREAFLATQDLDRRRTLQESLGILRFGMSSGEPWMGSLPEMLVAAWAFERGDPATASSLLLPLLGSWADEGEAFGRWRDELAVGVEEGMLDAFVGRDYAGALALARRLAGPAFAGSAHQRWAGELVEQLPRRQDDFRERRLPSEEEWARLRTTLARQEQVRYLGDRLRLIHDLHLSFPGGIDWGQQQYDRPLSTFWWRQDADGPKPKELINPYTELRRMDLSGEEAAVLVPLLSSSDYILAYDRTRFMPRHPMTLHRVRWLVASILDGVAGEDIVDSRAMEGEQPEQRRKALAHVAAWCAERGARRPSDRLEASVLEGAAWPVVQQDLGRLLWLAPAKARAAALERARRDPEHRADLLRLLALRGDGTALEEARRWAGDADSEVGLWASIVLLRHGGTARREGLSRVLAVLRTGEQPLLLDWLLDDLLALGEPEILTWLRALLDAPPQSPVKPTTILLQRLLLTGDVGARDLLLACLEGKPSTLSLSPEFPGAGGQAVAPSPLESPKELALLIARWGDFWPDNAWRLTPEQETEFIMRTQAWVRAEHLRVQEGGPPTARRQEPLEPLGSWVTPHGEWVLQSR